MESSSLAYLYCTPLLDIALSLSKIAPPGEYAGIKTLSKLIQLLAASYWKGVFFLLMKPTQWRIEQEKGINEQIL